MRLLLIFGGLLTRVDFLAEPGDETVLLKRVPIGSRTQPNDNGDAGLLLWLPAAALKELNFVLLQ